MKIRYLIFIYLTLIINVSTNANELFIEQQKDLLCHITLNTINVIIDTLENHENEISELPIITISSIDGRNHKNVSFKQTKIFIDGVEIKNDSIAKELIDKLSVPTEKPIIYLYPSKKQEIEVIIKYDGTLTHTYPKYNNGWKVTAFPDGTIYDSDNKEYYALYWEGIPYKKFTINEGFVVEGEKTIPFLENSLSKLGLNRKETNEFIIYWLPKMENNKYNLIHFSTDQYEEMASLMITPKPETIIRVMMVFQSLDKQIEIQKQNLDFLIKKRKGFTVVEWGGTELHKIINEENSYNKN